MLIFHKKYKNMNKNIITTIIKGYKIKYLKKKRWNNNYDKSCTLKYFYCKMYLSIKCLVKKDFRQNNMYLNWVWQYHGMNNQG